MFGGLVVLAVGSQLLAADGRPGCMQPEIVNPPYPDPCAGVYYRQALHGTCRDPNRFVQKCRDNAGVTVVTINQVKAFLNENGNCGWTRPPGGGQTAEVQVNVCSEQ
jgi:hypothetical protein